MRRYMPRIAENRLNIISRSRCSFLIVSSRSLASRSVFRDTSRCSSIELSAIQEKLGKVEYGERMANRIKSAYNFGANESTEFFFKELGLAIGPTEQSALKARNPMAHGSSNLLDPARYQETIDNTLAYRALFNRVLLKILDYEGEYVDYSAKGWPEQPLELPLAGRE